MFSEIFESKEGVESFCYFYKKPLSSERWLIRVSEAYAKVLRASRGLRGREDLAQEIRFPEKREGSEEGGGRRRGRARKSQDQEREVFRGGRWGGGGSGKLRTGSQLFGHSLVARSRYPTENLSIRLAKNSL